MKADSLKQLLLSKEQLRLHQTVIQYLITIRKDQRLLIQKQTPNVIPKKYHLIVAIVFTVIIVALNFDQLFQKTEVPTRLSVLENFDQIEKKVEYVFEHTIMRYSVLYPMKIRQCQSYIPFVKSDTLCSQKSIDVMSKLVYSIGFKPNYEKLSYNAQNSSIVGEWGPLQILNVQQDHDIQSQKNGFLNSWQAMEFQQKYRQRIKALKPQMEQRINQYIQNITSNENSLQNFQKNIKKSLLKILQDNQGQQSLSSRILDSINQGFDKILIFLSIDPLLPRQQKKEKDEFSPQSATDFYKQEVFAQEQQPKTESSTQVDKKANQQNRQSKKTMEHDDQPSIRTNGVQKYNSDQIRDKYNELLKKVM